MQLRRLQPKQLPRFCLKLLPRLLRQTKNLASDG